MKFEKVLNVGLKISGIIVLITLTVFLIIGTIYVIGIGNNANNISKNINNIDKNFDDITKNFDDIKNVLLLSINNVILPGVRSVVENGKNITLTFGSVSKRISAETNIISKDIEKITKILERFP